MSLIADGLEQYAQFIIYKVVPSIERPGKTDKFPIDYRTGLRADLTKKSVWTDSDTATNAAILYGEGHGVGFVFTEHDPFWFLDIDECLAPCGTQWSLFALSLLILFPGAAVEISSSGRGLHIFGSGTVPAHTSKNKNHNIEFYTQKRFVALTGNALAGSARTDHTAAVAHLISEYFTPINVTPSAWSTTPHADWNGPGDDDVLIARMLRSEGANSIFGNRAAFRDLWDADMTILSRVYNNDESAMDAALAQHLAFWTGNNCERMRNLMLRSKLVRQKWEREDYLPRTILSAVSKNTAFLCDKPARLIETVETVAPVPVSTPITGSPFLSQQQQVELFKGCIYIEDAHRVLVPGGDLLKPEQFKSGKRAGFVFPLDAANEKTTTDAWKAFIDSQMLQKPWAHTTCFRPARPPAEIIEENGRKLANIYWPVNTPRRAGDASLFLNHLKKLIPNDNDRAILLAYFAACVQHKGIKFQWAPFLQGVPGNGKTILTWCVAYAIGNVYVSYPRADQISAKFNMWLFNKILIGIEDIYVPFGQQEIIEILKPMITNEMQPIEPKGVDMQTREICCNFIINSNHKDGLPKSHNDRRFAPFFTAQQEPEDLIRDGLTGEYLSKLHDWLRHEGGYAIVSEFLHTYPIPDALNPANRKIAPRTSSTEDAIKYGRGTVEQEIIEAIEQGIPGFRNGWVSSIALDNLLRRLNIEKRLPRNRRPEILQSLGYVLHPGLPHGRVNVAIQPDGGKPRLFILRGHRHIELKDPVMVAKAYTDSNTIDTQGNNDYS